MSTSASVSAKPDRRTTSAYDTTSAQCTHRNSAVSSIRYDSPVSGSVARRNWWIRRTRAPARSASARDPYVVTPTKSAVRNNRPHGSFRNAEFWTTPRTARGCNACKYSARTPATHIAGSACNCHVTDPGPNNPGSPAVVGPSPSSPCDCARASCNGTDLLSSPQL